ncbi:MAG: carboxypeptidase-like regulatory domain-containing protein, partial [Flavobacterium sp.]
MKKQPLKKDIYYFYVLTFLLGLLMSNEVSAQKNTTITGFVKDEAGLSMPGVNILEKGTNNSASTDFDGKFSIKLTTEKAILLVSFISFQSQTINLGGRNTLTIKLISEEQTLKEVVIVGYGSVKKTDVTGAITTVKPETITERNATSPLEAIQGSTPGVQITSSTGRSGDGYNVVIRGNNSLLAGSTP